MGHHAKREARLSALHAALVALEQQLNQARAASEVLHATLMARDDESDLEIGAVVDEIWNALGRPAQSIDYNLIVGSGKATWTDGDPVKQPHFMSVLAANIRQSGNTRLAEKKEAWATRIEQKATALVQAGCSGWPGAGCCFDASIRFGSEARFRCLWSVPAPAVAAGAGFGITASPARVCR